MDEKPAITQLRKLLQLKNYKTVINHNDGSVVPPSSQVFTDLSDAMDSEIRLKPKNIYTILKLDRHAMRSDILKFYNVTYKAPIKYHPCSDDSDNDEKIRFTIDINPIWKDIKTEEVVYQFKNRVRAVGTLKRRAWTNVLFEEIYKFTKIQCPLTFKRSKTSASGNALTVYGFCSECDSQFNGIVANEPSDDTEPIYMECYITNYDASVLHKKKRQLKGSKRIEVATEMVEGKTLPVMWRRNEMDKLTDLGDPEPPHLFRLATLRKAKQERQQNLMGVKNNIYESLHLLKYRPQFQGAIRNIGLDPLYVHYWTNEQLAVYQKYHQVLYIDATGSLMKKVSLPNGESSSHIYLYQAVTKIDKKTGPVFQMISAVQNTNIITTWLMEFLRTGSTHYSKFPFPKEVITDFDRALMGAVVRAFAKQYTLADYLTLCFNSIQNKRATIPPCFVRLDICHFTNMIAKWKFWREYPSRVKIFYVHCLAVLRNQTTLGGIEEHAKAIFIIALNSNQSPNNSTDNSRRFLTMAIRGMKAEEYEREDRAEETSEDDEAESDDDELCNTNIITWANDLYETCAKEIAFEEETSNVNGFYCPKAAKKLKTLLPYFPLFSEVMPSIFGYGSERPTSAAVESEFNDLKHRILKHDRRPMRVDYFLSRHLSTFSGKLKLAVAREGPPDDYSRSSKPEENDDLQLNLSAESLTNEGPTFGKTSASYEEDFHSRLFDGNIRNEIDEYEKIGREVEFSPNDEQPVPSEDQNDRSDLYDDKRSTTLIEPISELDCNKTDERSISDKENCDPNYSLTMKKKSNKRKKTDEDQLFDELSELRCELNWRNKNSRKSSRRYGDPFPQFDTTLQGTLKLPIIVNGNFCSIVNYKENSFVVTNTCGFDSICQIIATSMRNNEAYRQAISKTRDSIFDCAQTLIDNGLKTKFYRQRAQLLSQLKLLKIDLSCDIISVNAAINISNLATELLADTPSRIVTYRCKQCHSQDKTVSAVVNVNHNILRNQGFPSLNDAIENGFFKPQTRCCGQVKSIIRHYGPTLMVDTDRGDRTLTKLVDIPLEVDLLVEDATEIKYVLAGVIAYTGTFQKDSVGHYTSFIKMYERWLKFDGNFKAGKSVFVNETAKVHAHMCIYTIQ